MDVEQLETLNSNNPNKQDLISTNQQKLNFSLITTESQNENQVLDFQSIQNIESKLSSKNIISSQELSLNDLSTNLNELSLKHIKSKEQIQIQSKENQEILVNLNFNIDDLFKKISSLTQQITNQLQTKQLKQKPLFRIQQQNNISQNLSFKQSSKIQYNFLDLANKFNTQNIFSDKEDFEYKQIHQQNNLKKDSKQITKNKLNFYNDSFSDNRVYNPIFFQSHNKSIHQFSMNMKLFQTGKSLGCGKFGQVIQCRNIKTGVLYALKKIFKSVIQEYAMQEQMLSQIRILSQIDHPNIVQSYKAFTDDYHIFILMEYVHGIPLTKKFKSSQIQVKKIIIQVLEGIKYLHLKKITHRDIKPQNIILSGENVIKICDLGWAAQGSQKMRILCGTLDYISPQMAEQKEYSQKIDLWNLGVLAYQLIYGYPPFKGSSKNKIFQQVKSLQLIFPSQIQISQQCKEFIRGYLKRQDQRQSIQWGLKHAFLKTDDFNLHRNTSFDMVNKQETQEIYQSINQDFNKLFIDLSQNNSFQQFKRQIQINQQNGKNQIIQ